MTVDIDGCAATPAFLYPIEIENFP